MIRSITYLLLFLVLPIFGHATHNRSGSITYRHIAGNKYEFTVTTCTKHSSEADRPELEISWGDGEKDTLYRSDIDTNLVYDMQINTYIGTHTFTGPATYVIQVEDPNRNASVLNITNSVDKVFCIQTELVISPFIGEPNNSLIIEDCPCPEFGCVNELYCYNISAYDPDGDSLSYSLVPCKGQDCLDMSIPEIYRYPHEVGGGEISIDPYTGTLCWDYPELRGVYNIAIKISEYRNGIFVGSVIQDMQFEIEQCFHDAPEIEEVDDTCIYAGETISFPVTASDDDGVSIFATGSIFNFPSNPAVFEDAMGDPNATGTFSWTPTCEQADNDYYLVNFHAEDQHPAIQLSAYSFFRLKVNLPPVENLIVAPIGNTMELTWDPPACDGIVSYNIYRSIDSTDFIDDCCEEGIAAEMGYTLIGSSNSTEFKDIGPLVVGNEYCYMVTAVNSNGVESCLSEQNCDHLNFEIPVLTHVSIATTDETIGQDSVYWSYPKELNTLVFTGPYHYQLYRSEGILGGTEELVYTSSPQVSIINPDTVFYDNGLNTQNFPYTYRVELYSNDELVGGSSPASSIYINTIPNDNELEIVWEENTPWTNTSYEVYRENPIGSGLYDLIGTTSIQSYTDTGLVNGADYCYRIKSIGAYTVDGIVSPIENWSQRTCGTPIDLTPPCPPTLSIDGDCELEETYLTWNNPNNSCADDVTRYNLYFAPFTGDSLILLTSFNDPNDTTYTHKDRGSIAGCYYVTAIDSIQYNNESSPSNIACIDNCDGLYQLPNIFSPNGDGKNDLFQPILPIKFVDSIEINIQNRWGMTVFQTTDPMINWNGTDQNSGAMSPDGVYFYSIIVYEIKLEGLIPRNSHGNIQLINGSR